MEQAEIDQECKYDNELQTTFNKNPITTYDNKFNQQSFVPSTFFSDYSTSRSFA